MTVRFASIALVPCLFISCQPDGARTVKSRQCDSCDEVKSFFKPLRVGMSKSEVERHFPAFEPISVLTDRSQFRPGGTVELANGASISFAFDADDRIFYLSTKDPRVPLPRDVEIGSTFAFVRQQFPLCEEKFLPGFGNLIEICPDVWLGDPSLVELKRDEGVIKWVSLCSF